MTSLKSKRHAASPDEASTAPSFHGTGAPSNTPWPLTGDRYPAVTYHDAVRVQRQGDRTNINVGGIQIVVPTNGQ